MRTTKNTFSFIFLMLSGIVLGGLLGELTANVPYLSFLNYGKTFGLSADSPLVLDLWFAVIVFGVKFRLTVAVIIGILSSIFIYKKML